VISYAVWFFCSTDTRNPLFQSSVVFLNEALPQSWCRPSTPNTRKQLKRLGIVRPFQKVARRLHPRPGRPNPTGDLCSNTLSVDYPASDTAITAGGGTRLPGLQEYCPNGVCTPPFYDIYILHERVWGWDYLDGLCAALGYNTVTWESSLPVAGEARAVSLKNPCTTLRNRAGFLALHPTGGGTSFVAPQLNGVSAPIGRILARQPIGIAELPTLRSCSHRSGVQGSQSAIARDCLWR
jgi:hypothetical protein